jgi:hypothetical protein
MLIAFACMLIALRYVIELDLFSFELTPLFDLLEIEYDRRVSVGLVQLQWPLTGGAL